MTINNSDGGTGHTEQRGLLAGLVYNENAILYVVRKRTREATIRQTDYCKTPLGHFSERKK